MQVSSSDKEEGRRLSKEVYGRRNDWRLTDDATLYLGTVRPLQFPASPPGGEQERAVKQT